MAVKRESKSVLVVQRPSEFATRKVRLWQWEGGVRRISKDGMGLNGRGSEGRLGGMTRVGGLMRGGGADFKRRRGKPHRRKGSD